MIDQLDQLTQTAILFAVPLWLAGLGELIVERAGVINIGIEGMMLAGALAGWAATVASGSPWIGLAAAGGAGLCVACLFACAVIVYRADQVVAGTAINLLALGACNVGFKLCREAGLTERTAEFFQPLHLSSTLLALNQYGFFYATLILSGAIWFVLRHTRFGIELITLGEYPAAALALGIRVRARRAGCILFGGLCAGLAGSYLSIMFTNQYVDNMTAGRGFLALAMVIFGRWHPAGLLAGGMFFGYVYATANYLEVGAGREWISPSLLEMMPYLLSLLVLAGFVGRTRAPAALGRPLKENG